MFLIISILKGKINILSAIFHIAEPYSSDKNKQIDIKIVSSIEKSVYLQQY
jgi:hypothetical protein